MRPRFGLICLLAFFALPAASAAAHGVVEHGTLGVVHKDGFSMGPTEFDYTLSQGERTLDVLPTQLGSVGHGDRVVVRGRQQDGRLVGRVLPTGRTAWSGLGQHTLAVVLMNWAGDQRQPWTAAEVQQRIFTDSSSMNAFYKEETYDQISFTGDVHGWYTIDSPSTGCNINDWTYKATQAASAGGVNLNGYDHVMFVFPSTDCPFGGAGHVSGPYSWINGSLDTYLTAHEMGHNLGLHHANSYSCIAGGSPVTISDTCVSNEYGDPLDVMGSGGVHHNHGWHLQRLGVLAPSNVQTITESGTYTMHSALAPTTEPTTLRIPRTHGPGGNVLDYYYLEVRQAGGVFENDYLASEPALNGVTIRLNADPSVTTQSQLLKANPSGNWWRREAPFLAGSSFDDGSIQIGVTSAAAGQATVTITAPPMPDTQAPTVPTGLSATATANGVELSWNPSTDNNGVTSYAILRDGAEIATSATTSFTDTTAAPGPHAYVVAAEDAAHNRSGMSAPATATVPAPPPASSPGSTGGSTSTGSDPNPGAGSEVLDPSGSNAGAAAPDVVAPRMSIRRKRSRSGRVSIKVRATDTVGVAKIELFIGGKRRKTVRLSASSAAGTLRYIGRIPRGARAAAARATDRSGNRSKVTFRLPL